MDNEKPALTILYTKEGFLQSIWSDFTTFGFVVCSFALNDYFLNSNNWLNLILFIMSLLFIAGLAFKKDRKVKKLEIKTVNQKQEAIDFINKWFNN